MAQPYPIVGIESTGIQPRLEIRDLQAQNPIQFSLFIRGLKKVQDMSSADKNSPDYFNNPNSYFQIGSIHGLPHTAWSGDPNGPQEAASQEWEGYCYHSSALFPTWHRVLILLIEQAVVKEAIAIASVLEAENPAATGGKWLQAAKQLRFPFWDWTRPETATQGIPQLFQDTVLQIANPGRPDLQVDNPLNHYNYASSPGIANGIEYMGDWKRTYRWVDRNVNPRKESYDAAQKALAHEGTLYFGGELSNLEPASWLKEKVAGLFKYPLTVDDPAHGPNLWGFFSNTGSAPDDQGNGVYSPVTVPLPSIEEPHNKVHLDCGGNGSLASNEYAGYDPIFFLHHCNVDRLYAFWEYLYPKYRIENGWKSKAGDIIPFRTAEGSFYLDKNAEVNHATSLVPFRTKSSNYWTSDEIGGLLNTDKLQKYYTYPAIKDPITGVEVKVDVPYDVNNLDLRQQYQRILHNEWSHDLIVALQSHRDASNTVPDHVDLLLQEEEELSHLRHFYIVGTLPEFAFPGSYRLELYLLPQPGQQTPVQVIGSVSVLGRADPANCPACEDRRAAGNTIRGHMYLDPHIVLYLILRLDATQRAAITTVDHITTLIQGSVGLRLVKPDGTTLAAADASIGSDNTDLEDEKVPQLTLHSSIISLHPTDPTSAIQVHDHVTHGILDVGSGWKAL